MPGDGTWELRELRRLGVEEALDISATDPVEHIRALTGDGVDVVIDAASSSTSTVTQGMQMARRGGTVVIGGLEDRKPVDGFISDWIPMRQLHLHAGFPGDHVKTSVKLIRQGRVPTAALLGEAVTVDGLGDALSLLARTLPGRDAIRLALRMAD
jgi:S-(hydroxymethyl)glutathione dehydrogenase/alcohol dehydrogenase